MRIPACCLLKRATDGWQDWNAEVALECPLNRVERRTLTRTDSNKKAVRAIVRGGVQGVGYRDATVRRARWLEVMGWVRNGEDGSVLIHAEGLPDAVEEMVAFLREGPSA
jgi:acylphosphatase